MNTSAPASTIAAPVRAATTVLHPTKPIARHQGRSVQQVTDGPAIGSSEREKEAVSRPARRFDFSASFAVNVESPDFVPLEKQVPQPGQSPTLKDDLWLSETSHQPGSLESIEKALEQKRQLESQGRGDEFIFEPLVTTLENMQVFIRHIRDGQQFTGTLTPKEDHVLAALEEKTALLLKAGAPYRRTVRLAMTLVAVCEEMTNLRILVPFEQQRPDFFKHYCSRIRTPICLDWLLAHSGDDNSCDAASVEDSFFSRDNVKAFWEGLAYYLARDDLLLYPSFHPLGLKDFCGFGHLDVHPVGMTTDYLMGADSSMKSPLRFAVHDLGHMYIRTRTGADFPSPPGPTEALFHSPAERLNLRQLLLDRLPANPALAQCRPALTLLLFHLLHEMRPKESALHLGRGEASFLGCLSRLGRSRRYERAGYEDSFRKVTDSEAGMAALWAVRLWEHWEASGASLTQESLCAHAQRFLACEAPLLQEHLDFINRHRGVLRQLFVEQSELIQYEDDQEEIAVFISADGAEPGQPLRLFASYEPRSGLCNLDNTDLAWFSALAYSNLRDQIEQRTGDRPPADLFFSAPLRERKAQPDTEED